MPAAKKATSRPKRRVVSPAETRTQLRLAVDSKFTKSHFSQLFCCAQNSQEERPR
jgi:hypothetical protein